MAASLQKLRLRLYLFLRMEVDGANERRYAAPAAGEPVPVCFDRSCGRAE